MDSKQQPSPYSQSTCTPPGEVLDAEPLVKAVYTIARVNGLEHRIRIGAAVVNTDGSYSVRLDAVPVGGALLIRDASPRELRGVSL